MRLYEIINYFWKSEQIKLIFIMICCFVKKTLNTYYIQKYYIKVSFICKNLFRDCLILYIIQKTTIGWLGRNWTDSNNNWISFWLNNQCRRDICLWFGWYCLHCVCLFSKTIQQKDVSSTHCFVLQYLTEPSLHRSNNFTQKCAEKPTGIYRTIATKCDTWPQN